MAGFCQITELCRKNIFLFFHALFHFSTESVEKTWKIEKTVFHEGREPPSSRLVHMSESQATFSTLNDALNAEPQPADASSAYRFLKHAAAPELYLRVSKAQKGGYVQRAWTTRVKTEKGWQKPVLGLVTGTPLEPAMSLADAIAAAVAMRKAASAPRAEKNPSLTVKETCELFLARLSSPSADLAEGTITKYRNSINRYLLPLGDKLMEDLKEPFWREFKSDLLSGKNALSGAPLAVATVQGIFSAVTQLYKVAHEHRGIKGESPGWDPSRIIAAEGAPANRRKGHIPRDLVGKAWLASDVLVPPGWRDQFRLYLLTGLRDSLLSELKWEYVDFRNSMLVFPPLSQGTKRHRSALADNERNVPILMPISDYAMNILRRRKLFAPPGNDYVFYAAGGARVRGSSEKLTRVDTAWAHISDAIGRHFTKHDLRRTFASIACTVAPSQLGHISLLLMHSNKLIADTINVPEITMEYIQDQVEDMRGITEKVTQFVLELAGEIPKSELTARYPTLVLDESLERKLDKEYANRLSRSPTAIIEQL